MDCLHAISYPTRKLGGITAVRESGFAQLLDRLLLRLTLLTGHGLLGLYLIYVQIHSRAWINKLHGGWQCTWNEEGRSRSAIFSNIFVSDIARHVPACMRFSVDSKR